MWSRLNAMRAHSTRWKNDGIANLKYNVAGDPLESEACTSCSTPEDPVKRRRVFNEHWSRVSLKSIATSSRIQMRLLLDSESSKNASRCALASKPLKSLPAGLESLRKVASSLLATDCGTVIEEREKNGANFLLLNLNLGQAL